MRGELGARVVLLCVSIAVPLYVLLDATTRVPALAVPVSGVLLSDLRDSFDDPREGSRRHDAIDIEAPESTPVTAASGGIVSRTAESRLGGLAVYVIDPGRIECHYYGHLSRYAPGLERGRAIARGEVLGFVGSTGNASPDAPHLHFAVFRLRANGTCAFDEPRNPYPLLTER